MAAVTLTTVTGATYTAELRCARTFRLAATGNAGQATIVVPYSSPLAAHITPDAKDLVLIHDGLTGSWRGVVTQVVYEWNQITLSALQPWGLIGRRIVKRTDTVQNAWPGYLAGLAMDAASVLGLFRKYHPPTGDTPLVPSVQLDYSDAWGLLQTVMDQSDGELRVDAATGRMDWCGQLAYANAYGPLLIAGQSLREWRLTIDAADQIAEVIGISGTQIYTTTMGENAAHWPAQAAVSAGTLREARDLAEQELSRRAFATTTLEGSVTTQHADIREGDYVTVMVPAVNRTYVTRVLGRAPDDSSPLIALELQVMPDGATTRIPAPGKGSRARGRGYGSVGQRLLRLGRQHT